MEHTPVNFVSKNKIDVERGHRRQAREDILSEAEEKYKRKEKEIADKKERGEDTWLLPSVQDRISSKKSKKHKKDKKKKKKKHKKKSKGSDSDSDSGAEWIEASKKSGSENESESRINEEAPRRDDWMVLPSSLVPAMTREELRQKSSGKPEASKQRECDLDKPGQSSRELNPYWKNGGTGVPEKRAKEVKKPVGDGGLSWLKRAYKRVQQQAQDQGRSSEEVAAERWGSLAKLEKLIEEAHQTFEKNKRDALGTPQTKPITPEASSSRNRHVDRQESHNRRKYSDSGQGWRKKPSEKSNIKGEMAKVSKSLKEERSESSESSSSSDECESNEKEEVEVPRKVYTEKELNSLGAKILKFELMGNTAQVGKLKKELEIARKIKNETPDVGTRNEASDENNVILTRTDKKGVSRPVMGGDYGNDYSGRRRKKQKMETHDKSGDRVRYFADDDKFSLKEMFEREKLGNAEDQDSMMARLAGQGMETNDDMDDVMISRANRMQSESRLNEIDRSKAIDEHKKKSTALDNCRYCFDGANMQKHLIIAIGIKTYLCLPAKQSLTDGHCLIVPMQHVTCATQLDEDVWSEIQIFRKILTKMFEDQDKVPVFFETNIYPKRFPHMAIECVSMDREIGDMAPIYFKKAILESEKEWSQNKKLVELKNRDVRKAIPVGLPYFFVDFGLENGFAHVIEEENDFPSYFAQEIIGGMLDLEPRLWRKPSYEKFEMQRKKVLQFAEWWSPYDWTKRLKDNE